MARVVLAMSGGVDSSVSAHLLRSAGHEVIGVFMRHGEASAAACSVDGSASSSPLLPILQGRRDHKQGCCSASDADDARAVAQRLDIPFYALDLQREFGEIVDYFIDEYRMGRTPNPCVICNQNLKFGRLFDYADAVEAEYLATGHYARLVRDPAAGEVALCRGRDSAKDQSYALFGVPRERLERMMLPVGDYTKSQIRQIAVEIGLNVAAKRDSQEICFVTSGEHDRFIRERFPHEDRSGDLVTIDGRRVGRHAGIESFTVGQRKGLGVAFGEPMYVVRIDPETREVFVGPRSALDRGGLIAERTRWLVDPGQSEFPCQAMIRYNSRPVRAWAQALPDDRLRVRFDVPCAAVAPGQAVVLYDGDRVLGGGWIMSSTPVDQTCETAGSR